MKARPYSMIPALPENLFVYVFSYTGNENDFEADATLYDVALKEVFGIDQTITNNGIKIAGTDLTVADATGDIAISVASTTFSAEQVLHPVVLFKGVAVPYTDMDDTSPPSTTDGLITITAAAKAAKGYTLVNTDYEVYYGDHLSGIVASIVAGGVDLPLESSSYGALGHQDPVYKTEKRGDPESAGSITIIDSQTSHLFDASTAPINRAGEELLSRVYGTDWNPAGGWAARSNLGAPSKPFGIAVLKTSGVPLSAAGYLPVQQGSVWGSLIMVHHCRVTRISEPENASQDSTDPLVQTVEFESRYPDRNKYTTILVAV